MYGAKKVQIGNKIGNYASILVISGIPTKVVLNFEEIAQQAEWVALVEVGCKELKTDQKFRVQLRNVPFSK